MAFVLLNVQCMLFRAVHALLCATKQLVCAAGAMAQPPFRLWDFAIQKLEEIEADSSHGRKGKQQQPSSSAAAEQLQKLRGVLGDVHAGLENMFSAGQALPEATWKQLINDKVSKRPQHAASHLYRRPCSVSCKARVRPHV
jgi:hypothetical protein